MHRPSRRHLTLATATVVAAAAVAATTSAGAFDSTEQARSAIKGGKARNVILLIGDGMGDSEMTLARDYTVGADGRLNLDKFPLTGAYTTYAVHADGTPDYVTDSAASGTGWATGHKTVNGRISKTPGTDKAVPTILELAQKNGYATGSVTTSELTDATPAVLASHATDRSCQGPADMAKCPADTIAAGGPGSIAEQSVNHKVDVLLGGGKARFDQKVTDGTFKGMTVTEQARKLGYQVVTDDAGMKNAKPGKPVLGLFASGNVPVEWTGKAAAAGGTAPQRCVTSNSGRPAATPSLADSATKAIQLLEAKRKHSENGFFLQVEGASIDKQDHAADPCGQIGETAAFDRAVKVARDYAAKHPDTLVVTTADHGHTSQIVPLEATPPGLSSTLVTDEGRQLKVNYSTNTPGQSQEHTGTQVRIAAQGPEAYRVLGVTNQTDLFTTVREALRLR
ncbi:alkaline phosphatase [Streptomyces rapamycinicus]|uniref:Alkaline phosphatase n=2 Tax=Streptomyces rapamycinicus TaxID=1226757 RepID=A0A0A0N9U0_STRRN|nr:alkaline phosphatase [Streptomyces rapamycinicus]AGP53976.1 alkaline phosphatase [Streptomyces rapamycinicus NRRL 5491]MBB4781468.1 alkaline phosphatase/streptomycin-6-phosphatase [Streptomyces rapamycinicus]RLV73888.1 alkaline phosphatase [Streptomyces rapamycinicus NRRL 5491]UTO62080.1 alkaline phosphatase [Streptomyces rapamycinicus]UTP30032.1 alkaline phosphatase [Streptomyces rapamycinicus NRRL 5491]